MRDQHHTPRGALHYWHLGIVVLAGFAAGVFLAGAVVAAALPASAPGGLALEVVDRSAPSQPQLLYYLVLAVGALLAFLAALFLWTMRSSRRRMRRLVAERTAALRQTQEMLRLVLDAIPVRVHWKNRDSVYLGCNRRFAEDAELDSPEEIAGKTDSDLPWKEYAELYRGRDREVIQSGEPMLAYEQPRCTSDGRLLCLLQSKLPLRDALGNIIGVLSTYEDITKRKQAEEALRESEARYRAVVEYSPDGIGVSVENKMVYVNPAAVRLSGARDAGEILGRSVLDFVHEEDRAEVKERRAKMLATGRPSPVVEGKLRRLDGSSIEAEWMGVPIVYGGKPAILNSFRDMTEHRRRARAIQAIVRATAGSGEQFFRALVAELGKVLGVRYALAGVLLPGAPERVRTVALWSQGALMENFEFELEGTPCANVAGKGFCHYPSDVQRQFPRDKLLADMGVVSYLGIPLYSSSGAVLGILSVMDDQPMPNSELAKSLMTIFAARAAAELEREEALKGLRASEARYRQLHKSMMDAFVAVDLERRLTDCNETFRHMLGYEPEEMMTLSYKDWTPEKWHALDAEIRQTQVLARGYSDIYEKEYRRKDGTVFPVELRTILLKDDAGTPYGMWSIVRDITERKQAETALRRSEARYRTLFESAQDAIFLDAGEQFVDCNAMTLRMFGCRREQIIGQSPIRFSPRLQPDGRDSAEEAREKIREAYAGRPQFFEWRHCRLDGSEFDAEVSLNRLELAEQPMLLAIVRDITERKRARDQLEERVRERTADLVQANERLEEMDRLKSQFLATMSHELRTPLNSIIGFTGILRQGFAGPVNAEQKKQLELVFASAQHLLSLINDLLDLSRIEAGKVEVERQPFDFAAVVADVVQNLTPMARQKQLSLVAELPAPAVPMVGDRKRCYQVLLNLVNNAVKFTHRGGVKITAGVQPDQLRVTVADTGIGIKPEQMGLLFETFRQLDGSAKRLYEGTGLGLYLCRRLLTLMGGEISVESEFGHGSRFTFTLPRRLARAPEAHPG